MAWPDTDTLNADAGDDFLYGGAGTDTLNGGDGNDYLDGGAGTDNMRGGSGNDTYVVASTNDVVDERSYTGNTANNDTDAGGTDTVLSSITYTLASPAATGNASRGSIENLNLTDTGNINGTGNSLSNAITGNSGNNRLTGGGGNDDLDGLGGNDTAVMSGTLAQFAITYDVPTSTFTLVRSGETTHAKNIETFSFTGGVNMTAVQLLTPVATSDSATLAEDTTADLNVMANDTSLAGAVISAINGIAIAIGSPVAVTNGTVALNASGHLLFSPTANYFGPASFTYTITSGLNQTATSAVNLTVTNINDAPAGAVLISGTATENQTLVASNTLADADGLGSISYQWNRDGGAVGGATGATYTLGDADVGAAITVTASYTDAGGTLESVTSDPTGAVANVNDLPTGVVSITGAATEGQVLAASNTLADADGLGIINYQWNRNGIAISGEAGNTYTLGDADVGAAITVTASYTDLNGTPESVTSAPTTAVANVNDAPTGGVSIAGVATENQTLEASNTLADADGLGTISYQWNRDGVVIGGATGATYTLGDADVGAAITVTASYTDAGGTLESVTSDPTGAVANVNDAAAGAVLISGTATENQTLVASNTLADADGLGAISYQWNRDGGAVGGATGATYTLGDADVGAAITVTASYTDLNGTPESVTSDPTGAVSNVNDLPTGVVSITGTATENQTLMASNTLADADGLGTISYQWNRDGVVIGGATGATYTLGDADVGAAITVTASFIDLNGTPESVTSAATTAVANVNDVPATLSISGTTVNEYAANGTLVGNFSATDVDGPGPFGYSIVSQSVAGAFAISGGGLTVADYSKLDFEQAALATHTVTVRVSDGAGGERDQAFVITTNNLTPENVTGTDNADVFVGGTGDDILAGGKGIDYLYGEGGSDTLTGGEGDDVLEGGAGVDSYIGGIGNDAYYIRNLGANARIEDIFVELANEGIDGINTSVNLNLNEARFSNFENGYIIGTAVTNLGGNANNNVLVGNDAANSIYGLGGRDIMRGGGGADTFVYVYGGETGNAAATRDVIQDFLSGTDKINLTSLDANGAGLGNGTFVFQAAAGAAFTGVAGQLHYRLEDTVAGTDDDKTIIEGDLNGDLIADLQIELTGLTALVESDFYL